MKIEILWQSKPEKRKKEKKKNSQSTYGYIKIQASRVSWPRKRFVMSTGVGWFISPNNMLNPLHEILINLCSNNGWFIYVACDLWNIFCRGLFLWCYESPIKNLWVTNSGCTSHNCSVQKVRSSPKDFLVRNRSSLRDMMMMGNT